MCQRFIHNHSQQHQTGLGRGHCNSLIALFFRRSSVKLLMVRDHYAVHGLLFDYKTSSNINLQCFILHDAVMLMDELRPLFILVP